MEGLLCEAVALESRVLHASRCLKGTDYSESQQVSSLNKTNNNKNNNNNNNRLQQKSAAQDGSETVILAASQLLPVEGILYDPRTLQERRRLTDRIGCTRLAGSTMA